MAEKFDMKKRWPEAWGGDGWWNHSPEQKQPSFFEAPNEDVYLVCQHGGEIKLEKKLAEIIWLGHMEYQTDLEEREPRA